MDRRARGRVIALGVAMIGACTGGSSATLDGETEAASATTKSTSTSTSTDGVSSISSAASTTVETSSTAAETSTSTGCSWSRCVDVETAFECDFWAQDCPRGEKCAPWANDGGSSYNALRCVPIDRDPDAVGDPCTAEVLSGVDSCEKGAMCLFVDPRTDLGTCIALCSGDVDGCSIPPNDCCPAKSRCHIYSGAFLALCLPSCDPLAQDCPRGDTCIPDPGYPTFACILDASADMGVYGDPCEFLNVCDPGLYCIDPAAIPGGCGGASGCCSPWCDLSVLPDTCPGAGQECIPWFEVGTAPDGYDDVGLCALPEP